MTTKGYLLVNMYEKMIIRCATNFLPLFDSTSPVFETDSILLWSSKTSCGTYSLLPYVSSYFALGDIACARRMCPPCPYITKGSNLSKISVENNNVGCLILYLRIADSITSNIGYSFLGFWNRGHKLHKCFSVIIYTYSISFRILWLGFRHLLRYFHHSPSL